MLTTGGGGGGGGGGGLCLLGVYTHVGYKKLFGVLGALVIYNCECICGLCVMCDGVYVVTNTMQDNINA